MLFVGLYSIKPGYSLSKSLQQRIEWKPPEGTKMIAEYWLQNNAPHVIVIFETDNYASIMAANSPWMDLFDIVVVPATTAEEGLKLASQMMPKT